MIQLSSAGKRFGPKLLFENLDWLITPRDRVGLVGANGTGKTTLLKVLARLEPLDYGEITFAKGITSSYLPQDGLTLSGRTVLAECMSVFGDLLAMEQEMESLMGKMAELDPDGRRVPAGERALSCPRHRVPAPRRLFARSAGRAWCWPVWDSRNPIGIAARRNSPAAGRCALPWPSCCWKSPTCCCSTSPPITLTSKPATGWKST